MTGQATPHSPCCLSLDLEVDPRSGRILKIGAWRPDSGEFRHFKGRFDLAAALAEVDSLAAGASFVLGHNVIRHDLNLLQAVAPDLKLFALPVVDTLALSPLAFPRNPYHHLVKDYRLLKLAVNNPLADAQRAVELFNDQRRALLAEPFELVRAYHHLLVPEGAVSGLNRFFMTLTQQPRPTAPAVRDLLNTMLADKVCGPRLARLVDVDLVYVTNHPAIAYLLAWLCVAGENSVMPPWVRNEYPAMARLARELRATPCGDPGCGYCRETHDARRWLKRWFGYDDFRRDEQGRSLQDDIVASGIAGHAQLGILPTGGGKSLCYQLPALMRHFQTGALTIVISPLQALMKDQVDSLLRRGVNCAAAVNGLLSLPERKQVLDGIRLGDVGILLVSPEQVRNRGFREAIAQREIAAWVFDEAHCLSKWGHDFRPDYLYVARYIRERHGDQVPPVTCLTATAKPDVIEDIVTHFRKGLGLELAQHLGSTERDNLGFAIVTTREDSKYAQVHQVLVDHFGEPGAQGLGGGAIVYCSTQKHTEELAEFLAKSMAWPAAAFHGGMPPDLKKERQQEFIAGTLKVIVATNAFGMGIDKPDVRLVIHADIPGSLENYIQEAGRAGRDQEQAFCVLLYDEKDAERQFGMSARSRLTQRDIAQLLKVLRWRKPDAEGNIVITVGELLASEGLAVDFDLQSRDKDTRVKTALAWLENAKLLERNENRSQVFPASLRFREMEEARRRLASADYSQERQRQLLALLQEIVQAEPDQGLTTDDLSLATGLDSREVRKAFDDLEQLGLLVNDSRITAYLRVGVAGASAMTLIEADRRETALLALLREAAPDAGPSADAVNLNLRSLTQGMKDAGFAQLLPDDVARLLRSLAQDGRELAGGRASLSLKPLDRENYRVAVQREWSEIEALSRSRRDCGDVLLCAFVATLGPASRGKDLLAGLTLGQINLALRSDLVLAAELRDVPAAAQAALMYLHDQKVLTLSQGLSVFRNAMTLHLNPDEKARRFEAHDYQPLADHYEQRVSQIHVMIRYAELGQEKVSVALQMVADYFALSWEEFLRRYFEQRKEMLERATTEASWHRIRDGLSPLQAKLVTERRPTNRLVLAGPGSGKTRLVVHRVACLVRVLREAPQSILVVTFNRHAAREVRRRLQELIGDDAFAVVAHTYHGLAMRLSGASLAARESDTPIDFDALLADATRLLKDEASAAGDADDALRERLLSGFRWLLVDEYQDINTAQYDFLSALAGRTLQDKERKLTVLAVGDDDQNIYEFNGAEVEFIRRFEADYGTRTDYLVENFRSTRHIIEAANALIAPHPARLKQAHPIAIDTGRRKRPAGGVWAKRDAAVGAGRVQLLPAGGNSLEQGWLALQELQRLAKLDAAWDWSQAAVIAREWKLLEPLRAACEIAGVACHFARRRQAELPLWRWREVWRFIIALRERRNALLSADELRALAKSLCGGEPDTPGQALVAALIDDAYAAAGDYPRPALAVVDDIYEYLADLGLEPGRGLTLTTAHGAKGLEFDHVVVLDGGWEKSALAERRLYYVAMTRARQTLTLCRQDARGFAGELVGQTAVFERAASLPAALPNGLRRRYELLGPRDIDLGFAGRDPGAARKALAGLFVGDELRVEVMADRWVFKTTNGQVVGRASKGYMPPDGRLIAARVASICVWRREDVDPKWRERMRADHWETVFPEVIIEPQP
ncbi:MAG: RecQ family ATP-dependent DNA helicase [Rhodocyclaceae bacterium]|nr:RecQ family ATP-dependent DNA helicase [Rhodocyclaceae bacterium]